MKILCPVDFSDSSINAAQWATDYLRFRGGGELEFLHCINLKSRSGMFLKLDDILAERAERDMGELVKELSENKNNVRFSWKVVVVDPKSFVPSYANRDGFDWIVVGTQGLTALKDITVGSVTEHLINKSEIPVIAVPANSRMEGLRNIVLGVDGESDIDEQPIRDVADLSRSNGATLHMIHYRRPNDPSLKAPPVIEEYDDLSWEYEEKDTEGMLVGALNTHCSSVKADMLCLIHHRRKWWQRIFTKSLTKSELFKLEVPLLVIGINGK